MTLLEFLQAKGFNITPDLSGQLQRFPLPGCKPDDMPGWFRGKAIQVGGRTFITAKFGDWRNPDEKHVYQDNPEGFSPDEFRQVQDAVEALEEQQREEEARKREEARGTAEAIWKRASLGQGGHPYLKRKKIPEFFGARLDQGALVLRVEDPTGRLHSLQFVRDEGKRFLPGGEKRGHFHVLQWGEACDDIYITEGFATAASIAEALGPSARVVCAFDAGNLGPAACALQSAHPEARIVICGDDDRWGKHNTGRSKAVSAVAPLGGLAVFPSFPEKVADQKPTDWNDLLCLFGVEEVRAQLLVHTTSLGMQEVDAQLEPTGTSAPGSGDGLGIAKPANAGSDTVLDKTPKESSIMNPASGGQVLQLKPIQGGASGAPASVVKRNMYAESLSGLLSQIGVYSKIKANKKGQLEPPGQQQLVDHLLQEVGNGLIKQGRDLFHYTGTHWRMFETPGDHDLLKVAIQRAAAGSGDMRFIDQVFKLLVTHLPSPPPDAKGDSIDLFKPMVTAANFLNGTLHASKAAENEPYRLDFRPHNPLDFLINVLPYEYRPDQGERNPLFEEMLGRIFQGDPDLAEKVRAIGQMFGAALMPIFPHLFMLTGVPGTGKSTVMKILARLVNEKNQCSVPPNHFNGFHMESMVGKLVNIHTDIPSREPIDDDVVKQLVDRRPFPVRRKGIKDLYVPLPALHVFGANTMPPTLEGSTGAHERRWSFLRFNRVLARAGGGYDKEFDQVCFNASPQGVLNFALAGLRDLLASNGHFLNPSSGKELLEEWQSERDPVALFLESVKEGEILEGSTKLMLGLEHRITRSQLWSTFVTWFDAGYRDQNLPSRVSVFKALRNKGFVEVKVRGERFFVGLGVLPGAGAPH